MIKRFYECLLLKIAVLIFKKRAVQRSLFVNRRDNEKMYAMSEQIENIEKRIRNTYKNERQNNT